MAHKNSNLFHSLNVTKDAKAAAVEEDNTLTELMANPEYLRHSSAIINDALKEGFDVLQMPNGDIVATGTKTVVHTYTWNGASNTLVRTRTITEKPRVRSKRQSKTKEKEPAAD